MTSNDSIHDDSDRILTPEGVMRHMLRRPLSREEMPCISIEPVGRVFRVTIDGWPVRYCIEEMDAHHWCKHAFEAVHSGFSTPTDVSRSMAALCRQATAFNLHA